MVRALNLKFNKNQLFLLFIIISLIISNNIYDYKQGDRISALFYFPQILLILFWFIPLTIKNYKRYKKNIAKILLELFLIFILVLSILRVDLIAFKFIVTDFVIFYAIYYGTPLNFFKIRYLNRIFIFQILISILTTFIGINKVSFLPYFLNDWKYQWQVSLFPLASPPYTGALSAIVFLTNIFEKRRNYAILGLSLFYLIFAGSRTMYIGVIVALLPLVNHHILKLKTINNLVLTYCLAVIIFTIPFWMSAIYKINNPLLQEILFRNIYTEKTFDPAKLDRILISTAYIDAFMEDPILGKGGSLNFEAYASSELDGVPTEGSETRFFYLLATLGITFILFVFYIVRLQIINIRKNNFRTASMLFLYLTILLFYGSFLRGYMLICFILYLNISSYTEDKVQLYKTYNQ